LDWTATGKLYLLGSGVIPIAATHERTVPKARDIQTTDIATFVADPLLRMFRSGKMIEAKKTGVKPAKGGLEGDNSNRVAKR
jgi:hypothetical protein